MAIIMDGNGRWAKSRRHARVWGHVRGSRVVSKIVERADDLGVDSLTLYAFSTENWSRPLSEVKTLFKLLKKFLLKERKRILDHKIVFRVIGDTSKLPSDTLNLVKNLEDETKNLKGLNLTFAFGYGGRYEITDAVNEFIRKNPGKEITHKDIQNNLYIPELHDVDLLIRTGGNQRISNFLLWQMAYAELYFTKTPWPEFSSDEFQKILEDVSYRERRFGSVCSQESLNESVHLAQNHKLRILRETGSNQ